MAFFVNKVEHSKDNTRCEECCGIGYPMPCVCGGLIHAQFIKETWQMEKELAFSCDSCGDKYVFPSRTVPKKPKRFTRRGLGRHR